MTAVDTTTEARLAEPWLAPMLLRDVIGEPPRPKAANTFARYSDAAACARKLAFAGLYLPVTNPMDKAGLWATYLGKVIHDLWQDAVADELSADGWVVTAEVASQHDDLTSGSADLLLVQRGRAVVAEGKSMGGFKFKSRVGATTYGAEGPSLSNVTQLALQVTAIGADEGRVVDIATEAVSKGQRDRFDLHHIFDDGFPSAEWTYTAAELADIAGPELERIAGVKALTLSGYLPRRVIPGTPPGAEITSAARGTWQVVDSDGCTRGQGNAWQCGYCPYQDLCEAVGPGRPPVESAFSVDLASIPTATPAEVGAINFGSL